MNTQRENSRDKILEAAFRLLSKKGYANVSMRDIAAEAQVALGLLTYHFRTKENLFTALASKLVSTCFDDVVREMERGRDEEERMHLLSEYFKKILIERPDVMKIFLDFSIQAMWNRSFKFQVTYLFNKLAELIRDDVLSKKRRTVPFSENTVRRLYQRSSSARFTERHFRFSLPERAGKSLTRSSVSETRLSKFAVNKRSS